jgi:CheY-like chemotaxis protein
MQFPKKIYLSDDDLDDVEFFQLAVADVCGKCSLIVSNNGEELLSQLGNCGDNMPDIIFLDVNMPKVNGLEALKRIKDIQQFHSVPVIVYSTTSNDVFVNDAHKLGANFYFVKPSDLSLLRSKIQLLLNFDWTSLTFPTDFSQFVLKAG